MSEIMTILIHFHQSHYRNFKAYYTEYVWERLRPEFSGLVSYNRFVEFTPSVSIPRCVYLRTTCLGTCSGISFIDSTALAVCKNPRIHSHKVFAGLAARFNMLKNISQIEHSRHRSPINFLVNLLCGVIAYCRQPKKPSFGLGALPALVA